MPSLHWQARTSSSSSLITRHGDRVIHCSDDIRVLTTTLTTMLLRGTLVHTPRLGDLEILDDYLIGLKYVRAKKKKLIQSLINTKNYTNYASQTLIFHH